MFYLCRSLLCSFVDPPKAGQVFLELLGRTTITTMKNIITMNHTRYSILMKDAELKPYLIQAVDYSYSDYDYQPEEGRSLGAEDEYYEDITPARAYNFQFEVFSI